MFGCRPGRTTAPWPQRPEARWTSSSSVRRPVVGSGVSPERTSTSSAPATASRAERTASPVPRVVPARRRSRRRTPRRCRAPRRSRKSISERLRVQLAVDHPSPQDRVRMLRALGSHARSPSSITTAAGFVGIRGYRWLGRPIRTWDHGTRPRCLTAPAHAQSGDGGLPRSPRAEAPDCGAATDRGAARPARSRRPPRPRARRARQARPPAWAQHDDQLRDGGRQVNTRTSVLSCSLPQPTYAASAASARNTTSHRRIAPTRTRIPSRAAIPSAIL